MSSEIREELFASRRKQPRCFFPSSLTSFVAGGGSRTSVYCLEGSHNSRYTTPAMVPSVAENMSELNRALLRFILQYETMRLRYILAGCMLLCPLFAHAGDGFSNIPDTFRFARTLVQGIRSEDVRYLQILLNSDPDTEIAKSGEAGGAGKETAYFGPATKRAVKKFQEKYRDDVLAPAGLAQSNGRVAALTRHKLNAIITEAKTPRVPEASKATSTATTTLGDKNITMRSFDEINTKTRKALVNILCTTKRGGLFKPLSGSGTIIDSRGVILTNAHVAQFYLLKDYLVPDFVDCTIRKGEPARNAYRARLLYISPDWVKKHYKEITEDAPAGTGENDFALLLIDGSTDPSIPLPASFPALTIDEHVDALRGVREALVAGYPAGFLSGISIQKDLYPASSIVGVGKIFGFSETVPDLFSTGGSPLAQQGSSGGAVVNDSGTLIGLVVTSTTAATTGGRDLRAITLGHVARSFKKETGDDMRKLLASDIAASADNFNKDVAPALTALLEGALNK